MQHRLALSDYIPDAENCGDCRARIGARLAELPGVSDPEVSRREVSWCADEAAETAQDQAVIHILAELRERHHHKSWKVGGMDCPSCAKSIERAVGRVEGVDKAQVAFATERLNVEFDPTRTGSGALADVVTGLGFSLEETARGGDGGEGAAKSSCGCGSKGATCGGAASEEVSRVAEADTGSALWRALSRAKDGHWSRAIGLGLLLAAAAVAASLLPEQARWFYSAAALAGLYPVGRTALRNLRHGQFFGIQTLMSVAAIGALFIGEALEAAMVLFLFQIGEALEQRAAAKAREGVSQLLNLQPKFATLVEEGGRTRRVPAESLEPGQVIEVKPGERLPADGVIEAGAALLDESALTGESMPRERGDGEQALAGALVLERLSRFRVTSEAGDNTLDRIVRLIEESEAHRAPVARFIDRFSAWYTPAIMAFALLAALVPPLAFGAAWEVWIYKALTLLIIGCPCALVISVPAAVTSSLAAAARAGALIKGGAALECLGRATTMAFDKTGTLTEGRPQVTDILPLAGEEHELLALAAAVERGSGHPLAEAIVRHAEEQGVEIPAARESASLTGKAATGKVEGALITVGSPSNGNGLLAERGDIKEHLEALEAAGKTVVLVSREAQDEAQDKAGAGEAELLGLIALRDEPRAEAREALADLKALGLATVMLTGDNPRTGAALGAELGLEVKAGLLPQDKLREIEALRGQGPGNGGVVMVGDGINDAPALKIADVGIAMGGGTDVALEAADLALMRNRLEQLPALVRRARATLANIRQNVAIALGLKGLFLVTTLLGLTGLWMAVLADTGATVLVTLNALRLLRSRPADSNL